MSQEESKKRKLLEVSVSRPRDNPRTGFVFKLYEVSNKVKEYLIEHYKIIMGRRQLVDRHVVPSLFIAKMELLIMVSSSCRQLNLVPGGIKALIIVLDDSVADLGKTLEGVIVGAFTSRVSYKIFRPPVDVTLIELT